MRQTLLATAHYLPFIGLALGSQVHTPLFTRLIEAGIIGAIVLYGNVRINEHTAILQQKQINAIQENQKDIHKTIVDLQIIVARMQK